MQDLAALLPRTESPAAWNWTLASLRGTTTELPRQGNRIRHLLWGIFVLSDDKRTWALYLHVTWRRLNSGGMQAANESLHIPQRHFVA